MTTVITPSSGGTLTYDTVSLNGNLLTSFTYGSSNSITFDNDITIYSYLVVSGGNGGTTAINNTKSVNNPYVGGNGGAGGTVIVNTPSIPIALPANSAFSVSVGAGGTNNSGLGGTSSINFYNIVSTTANASTSAGTLADNATRNVTSGELTYPVMINAKSTTGATGAVYSVTGVYYGGAGGAGGVYVGGYSGAGNEGGIGGIGGGGGGGGSQDAVARAGSAGSGQLTSGSGGAGGTAQGSNTPSSTASNGGNGSSYTGGGKGGSGGGGGGGVRNLLGNTLVPGGRGGNGGTSLGATSGGTSVYGAQVSYVGGAGGGGAGGVNTGGGGGGAGGSPSNASGVYASGGAGGSGIVIIYYRVSNILNASNKDANGFTYSLNSSNNTNTATLTASPANFTNVNVLSTVVSNNITYTVTAIGVNAFNNKNTITSVTIPSSIVSIGASAFQGCSALNAITIQSSSITSVGTNAFSGLPASITVSGNIPASAFTGVTSLTNITIGANTTSIGASAFQGCTGLTTIIIPVTITSIGASAFQGCTNLLYMSLPATVTNAVSSFLSTETTGSIVLTNNSANNITYTIANNQAIVSNYSAGANVLIPINVTTGNTKYPVTRIADGVFSGKSLNSVLFSPFITFIGNSAFKNNALTSVNLPPGLTSIGTNCFENNLITTASLPSGLTSISASAFQNNRLVSINISPSIVSIGNYAFAYNFINSINNATSIVFPSTMTTLGQYAFYSNQISNLTIPTTINTLSDYVFAYNLLQTISVPSNITTIGTGVFQNNSLTSFTLPNNITAIPSSTFMANKFTTITIPAQITSIGYAAFFDCNPRTLTFASTSNVKTIEEAAFRNHQLQTVSLPTSITFIGQYAFSVGTLTTITIPSSVTILDNGAFYGNQITSVTFTSPCNITYLSSSLFENNRLPSLNIPSSVTSISQFACNNNLLTSVSIPSSVTSIGQYAFANNNLTPASVPSQTTIASIGYAAFYNNAAVTVTGTTTIVDSSGINYSLLGPENNGQYGSENQYIARISAYTGSWTSLIIPFTIIYATTNQKYNVTSIANSAFSQKNLTSVILNMNINSIGQSAFTNNNLTSISIPNSVTSLGDSAFFNNRLNSVNISTNVSSLNTSLFQQNRLTTITIPQSINSLGSNVFADNSLNSIIIPAAITAIPQHAFRNNRLTSIDLSNTPTNQIANNAFQNNAIAQLSIPSRITSIGNSAFQNNRLSSVTFAGTSSITTFNDYVFADNSLNSISIPSSVTTIGNNALQNNLLTSIQLPANLVYIGQSAFQTNQLQSTINIPATVNYIGTNAFTTNLLSNTVSSTALITFLGNNQTGITTLGANIFNNNVPSSSSSNRKVYITYIYGKKWASSISTLTNTLIPPSFASVANNIQIIIQQLTISPSISIQNKVYDGTINATGSYILIGAIQNDNVTVSANATFIDKNAGQNKVVNVILSLSGDSSSNYILSTTTASTFASITPKTIAPSITAINKTYDASTNANFSYNLPGVISPDNPTLNGTAVFLNSSAGTNKQVTITGLSLSGDSSSNYVLSSTTASSSATIFRKYVYFTIPNKIYDASSTITSYDLSGLYASDASNVIVSGLLSFSGVTVGQDISVNASNIALNGSKSSNYDASYLGGLNNPPQNSNSTRLTGNIVQKTLGLSSTFTKTYDGTVAYTNPIVLSGVMQSDIGLVDLSYTVLANYDVSAVTANNITISNIYLKGTKSLNYSINPSIDVSGRIFPKPIDISATIVKTYDKTANTYNNQIDLSGIISVDNGSVGISYSSATYNSIYVGRNSVTIAGISLTGTKSPNYTINSIITVNGIIKKKILDISASPITKIYDTSTTFNFIVDLSGVLSGDNVSATGTGDASGVNVATYNSSNISTNYTRFVLSGPQSDNYDISSNSIIQIKNNATITRKFLTASANVIDKTYNGDVSANVTFVLNGILSNDIVDVSTNYIAKYINANAGQNKQVDVSNITLYGNSSGNYYIDSSLLLYGSILQKTIDLSYIPITKTYDRSSDASNAINFSLIGTMDASTNVRFTSANFDTIQVGTNKQVTINGISIYGDTSYNYTLPYTILTANGNITPKNLALSVTSGTTKIYDSNNNAYLNISLTGVVNPDIVNVTYESALFNNSHVGQNKTITISGIALTGSSALNYNIYSSTTTTGSITAYPLTQSNVTGIVTTKLFDPNKPTDMSAVVQFYLNNILSSDQNNLYIIYSDAYFIKNQSVTTVYDNLNNLNVHVYGLDLSGTAKNDYNLNITTFDLSGRYISITPSTLSIVLNSASITKIYDGTPQIDVSLSLYNDASNIIPSDVSINYVSSIFDNKNVGTNKNINITGIFLTGTQSYKYITDSSLSTASRSALTGSISKKLIDISRNVITKQYDGNQNLTNILLDLSGVISGDSITCNGDASFNNSSIGQKTVTVRNIRLIGDSSMNYELSSTTIDLSGQINPKLLTVFASKIYDASNTVFQHDLSLSGIVQNQIVTINASGEYYRTTPGNTTANLINISLTGDNSSNYTLPSTLDNINASIYKKELILVISKVYNGSNNIISTNVSLNGILNNEITSFSGTGLFVDASAGNNIQTTDLSGSLIGNNKDNYTIDVSGVRGNILPKQVNVIVDAITYKQNNIADLGSFSILTSLISNDRFNNKVYLTKPAEVILYYDSSQAGNRIIQNASGNLFLTGDLSKNYYLNNSLTINAVINKKGIDLSTNSKVYDGSTNLSNSNIVLKNIISGDDVSLSATQIYSDISNVGSGYAYIRDASLNGTSSNNYIITGILFNNMYRTPITVIKRPITVGVYPRTYDGTTTVYNQNLYLNNVIASDNISVTATGSYNSIHVGTNKSVDLLNIQLSGTSRLNYSTSLNATASGEIYRRIVGITILPRTYDGSSTVYLSDFSLNNIVNIDKGKIFINGSGTYNSKNVGTRTVDLDDLSLYGDVSSNYDISSNILTTGTINQLNASLSILPKKYDTTTNINIEYVYVKNKITNDIVDVSGNGSYDSSFVGNRTINLSNLTLTGFDNANYYIPQSTSIDGSIIPHPLRIIINDREYNGDNIILDMSLTNIFTNTIGIYPVDVGRVFINGFLLYVNNIAEMDKLIDISNNLKNVYLTGDCSNNYYIYNNIFETGNILPKQITITPNATAKVYDTFTDANVQLEISGLVAIDNGKYFAHYEYSNYYDALKGNEKPIMIQFIYITGPYVQNYIYDTSATSYGDILPAPLTITAIPSSKIYDNTISTTAIYSLNGVFEKDIVNIKGDASFNDKNRGNNKQVIMKNFVLSGDSSSNYYIVNTDIIKYGTANIYPAKLIPSIGSISNKTYDGSINTTGTINLSGKISDNQVTADGTFTFTEPRVSNNIPVNVNNIYLIGDDAFNYELSFNYLSGTSNIIPLQLNILPYTKTYDGTTNVSLSEIRVDGMLNGENIGLAGSAVFDSPLIGTRTISINGAYLTGLLASNYTIQSQQIISATITKRNLTITVNNKTYDGSNGVSILNVSLNGIQSNDNVSISSITANYANNGSVQNNIHINVSNVVLTGDLSSQYDIYGTSNVSGNIIPKTLTASASANNKYYDGLTRADANIVITDGLNPGDNVYIISSDANFDTPDIGDDKPVSVSNIQLGGPSSNNYNVLPITTNANIVYNPYITTFSNQTYTKPEESYQTTTNTSARIRYSMFVTRNS